MNIKKTDRSAVIPCKSARYRKHFTIIQTAPPLVNTEAIGSRREFSLVINQQYSQKRLYVWRSDWSGVTF